MLNKEQENIQTIRRFFGLDENEATEKLATRVKIIASDDDNDRETATEIAEVLGMTLQVVSPSDDSNITIIFGAASPGVSGVHVYASLDNYKLIISRAPLPARNTVTHKFIRKLSACYLSGYVIGLAMRHEKQVDPFIVNFENLGVSEGLLSTPIVLADTALAGAGGVANGFMWALRELEVSGELTIIDSKKVRSGHFNRCRYFSEANVDENKAQVLCANAAISGLMLKPFNGKISDFIAVHGNIKRVITTIDSRDGRRAIQDDFPLEVIDASTTDITEVVIHSNSQPTVEPCLSCIYPYVAIERQMDQHVADGLGLTIDDVREEFINERVARKLKEISPEYVGVELKGQSLTSLYKARCADKTLKTKAGEQAAAPLAFITHFAGLMLVLELIRFMTHKNNTRRENFMVLNPWKPPHSRLRQVKSKLPNCKFCSQPDLVEIYKTAWPEYFVPSDENIETVTAVTEEDSY